MIRLWLFIAGVGGAASVIAGAAAAHLADDPAAATLLRNGSFYGMIHAAALLAVIGFAQGREPRRGLAVVTGWCFAAGILLFSLGQFVHAATGFSRAALAVPVGGTAFIVGWAALAILAFRRR
ncbi:MAG: DUF423 domain-containing protein [Alphaproteobacteria bacterium]|nr:DUF423 domain-containing protein [Alphaproteobacteria bacterium]MBV9554629.1 DUF423 domain-containing protein [Alphaproteobacteria bacterium]